MKIGCVMVTRGRPKQASAAIEIAKSLSSGRHEIEFIVCCDDDDYETQKELSNYRLSIAPAPVALGEIWNRGAREIDADIICPIIDDSYIAAPDWDQLIVSMLERLPPAAKLLGWNDRANPGLMTLPILGADWYRAAGLYPGWFPYWFYDTWVAEVYSFVNGSLPLLPSELLLVAKKGKTQRMRDLGFWWDFYSRLRPERLEEAKRIRAHFNVAEPDLKPVIDYWEARDNHFRPLLPAMEAVMSDGSSQLPTERYIQAKRAAEEKLRML